MSARQVWFSLFVALGLCACGGSSSETPFPLPPHPMNEPYRVGSAVERTPSEAETPVEPLAAPAPPNTQPRSRGPAQGTWGSTAPEPLPELSPK